MKNYCRDAFTQYQFFFTCDHVKSDIEFLMNLHIFKFLNPKKWLLNNVTLPSAHLYIGVYSNSTAIRYVSSALPCAPMHGVTTYRVVAIKENNKEKGMK